MTKPIITRMKEKIDREKALGRKPEQIGSYVDPKTGKMVTVLAGPVDKPFKSVPVGWE